MITDTSFLHAACNLVVVPSRQITHSIHQASAQGLLNVSFSTEEATVHISWAAACLTGCHPNCRQAFISGTQPLVMLKGCGLQKAPHLTRSSQPLMFLGLPLRVTRATTDSATVPSFGSFACQAEPTAERTYKPQIACMFAVG